MFTTRISGDMKIFAADVAESSATATCNTTVQQQQQQQSQQLEFRPLVSAGSPSCKPGQCHLKLGKYNNKTANLLRQVNSCHSSNGSTSSNNNEANKGQQQLHYCNNSSSSNNNNNSHSWARKKYFGNGNSNNSLQQQQQHQSSYFQRQQQQQQQQVQLQQEQQATNNNDVLMKNQNIVSDCKSSDSSNNNNSSSSGNNNTSSSSSSIISCSNRIKPAKWVNENSSGSGSNNINNNNISCRNNNTSSNVTKQRNSSSADATGAYYRKSESESGSSEAAAESADAEVTGTGRCNSRRYTGNASGAGSGTEETIGKCQEQDQDQDQSAKQRPRQQPLSFWKTNYPQTSANQLKDKETVAAVVSAAAVAAAAASEQQQQQQSLSLEHRRNSGYQQHQHHNYYPYYYSQPKQLTIASFLQKEMLPDSTEKSSQHSSRNTGSNSSSSNIMGNGNRNFSRHQYGHQSAGSGYQQQQQRYRNAQNVYQQYQHQQQHQQQQQQQQHHAQQEQHTHPHFRRKHSENGSGINKKMHYSPPGKSGDPADRSASGQQQHHHPHQQQQTIEILASSHFNAMHRRMQNGNNKNGYYQHSYNPMTGEVGSTPTRAEHQNIYNLTYIHVDTETTSEAASASGSTPVVKPSQLSKPNISSTTPTTVDRPLPPAAHSVSAAVSGSVLAAPANHVRNMFPPPPLAMLGGHGLLSPATTTTPTKMISCAQLDEAITAAAASGDKLSTSPSYNQSGHYIIPPQQQQQQPSSHPIPIGASSHPPPPPPPHMFFHFADRFCNPGQGPATVRPHSNSPCYPASYGSSCGSGAGAGTSPHNKDGNAVAVRPASPALSSSSLGSESHWSGTSNRSRLGHSGHLSISPTPSALGSAQLSPHLAEMRVQHPVHQLHPPSHASHRPHGQMGGHAMSSYVPHRPPPPPPHPSISSPNPTPVAAAAGGPWYEMLLPPDRYLAQARNIEVTVQPEKLICMCKYDNLSAEIWKRFRGAQQTHKKFKLKMRLWRYLYLWMHQPMFERYRICLVGSTITGFGTDTSDIDMCLLPEQGVHPHQHQYHQHQHQHFHNEKRTEALIILTLFNAVLKDTEVFQDFNLIEARVPILRFKDITNGIEVDLNFNNCVGIKNTYLLQLYAQMDWRTRPLVVIVKLWAQYHDINDAKRMTISSYSLVLMVLHYLQHACVPHVLPCLHSLYPEKFQLGQPDCLDLDLIEPIEPYQALNTQTLGEHLLGFFKYYSSFDFRNFAISIRTGGILPVSTCRMAKSPKNDVYQWKELNIEEPFDLSNTARSVYDAPTFERVKAVFLVSARRLDHTLDLATIFRPIHHVPEHFPQQQQFEQRSAGGGGANPASSKLNPDAASTFAETPAAHVV
ncbi:poly(A) RNA polymerase gld-2 homolog B [Drosophila erecta]|uniref:polynucleotide adenylyltransferase n=1 Tax=Drosophila erecta TaxID=7220 RepID=B3NT16_DROER|nr:poly(A) RNA polymerase gld-2 homolog B [Drosophila erecta]EDV45985.1 uncharacterized protein Dere_GG18455 [Drosophila erecta]